VEASTVQKGLSFDAEMIWMSKVPNDLWDNYNTKDRVKRFYEGTEAIYELSWGTSTSLMVHEKEPGHATTYLYHLL